MISVTRTSPLTGKANTMNIECSQEEYDRWLSGEHIQNAMPNTPVDQREFLISGTTPEDWATLFPPEKKS